MTHEIPQFYRKWVTENLGITASPDFGYHTGKNYAYLIMGGSKDAPGNLFIFVFRNPGREVHCSATSWTYLGIPMLENLGSSPDLPSRAV